MFRRGIPGRTIIQRRLAVRVGYFRVMKIIVLRQAGNLEDFVIQARRF
jgi:hypothetical protein